MASVRHLGLFPFCVPQELPSDQEVPSEYPVGLSAADVMLWFWRVKAAEVTRFINVQIEGQPPPEPDTEVVNIIYISQGQEFAIEKETEIICFTEETGIYFNVTRDGQEENFGFFFFAGSGNINSVVYDAESQLFYPRIIGPYGDAFSNLTYNSDSYTFYNEYVNGSYVKMTAHEFYTYDPGDGGGPIYDSTTGAQLRAFPAN